MRPDLARWRSRGSMEVVFKPVGPITEVHYNRVRRRKSHDNEYIPKKQKKITKKVKRTREMARKQESRPRNLENSLLLLLSYFDFSGLSFFLWGKQCTCSQWSPVPGNRSLSRTNTGLNPTGSCMPYPSTGLNGDVL